MSKKKSDPIPTDTPPIALGVEVRDVISQAQGIVTMRCENLSGVVQWAVQPQTADGRWAESYFTDGQTLDVVGPGLQDRAAPLDSPVNIELGDRVRDVVTGRNGVVTERIESFNGCIQFRVEGKTTKKRLGLGRVPFVVDHKRLLLLEADHVDVERRPTGGANRDVRIVKEEVHG